MNLMNGCHYVSHPVDVCCPAGSVRRAYVLLERRPEAGCWKPVLRQAHAPLPLPAGHARMPPGPDKVVTEYARRGFHAPAFTRGMGVIALVGPRGKSNVTERGGIHAVVWMLA
jgi:hypothetical protein